MANNILSTNTEWSINSDIYNIVDSLKKVQKRYIEDEDETTLSLGVFGFITDTEAKKIQTATIMAGQLGNEMFPTRALLTKNVLTHAAYNGIDNINAKPANMTVTICIKISDIENYNINDIFYLDSDCPIFIGEYEFHILYDIKIRKIFYDGKYSYSAQYILEDENGNKIVNRLSEINNPYLKQPFLINIGNEEYIGLQCPIKQYSIEDTIDTIVSDSIIENKSYTFTFSKQIADFRVICTDRDNKEVEITPYLYGTFIDPTDDYYCWYLYTADNSIRITFDSKSFIPGLNANIKIRAFTTIGSEGNFKYIKVDNTSEGLYIAMESDKYNYRNVITYLVAVTDSVDGSNRKSKEELQKLIPKAAMSRGSITTETDITNYFNLINDDINRLVMLKKVDNQISRIWYGYFMLKDFNNNMIPTNTIDMKLVLNDGTMVKSDDGRYILPAGSSIVYNPQLKIGEVIDDSLIPPLYTNSYFNTGLYYYSTPYAIVVDDDPLYASYYLTAKKYDSYFTYEYINEKSIIQFIANRFHFSRNILIDQDQYTLSFNIAKSINDGTFEVNTVDLIERVDDAGNIIETEKITTQNVRVILVLYKEDVAYRWVECTFNKDKSEEYSSIYNFSTQIMTDNQFDDQNRIKIIGMNECGGGGKSLYGYVDETAKAKIYILANSVKDAEDEDIRKDIDNIAPGFENYTVVNIYEAVDGISFFDNYTNITNTKIIPIEGTDNTTYKIFGVPVVGRHYIETDEEVNYLIDAMGERKAYIDYCLSLVENNMNVDFKFFNTYGPSETYFLEDKMTSIGNIDAILRFKVQLKDSSDVSTKDDIIEDIKTIIENLDETGDWHAPVLIKDIMNKYDDRINFIEFVGFNNFGADDQHIICIDSPDPNVVPEFINIRNIRNKQTYTLDPLIEIELV